MSALVRKGYEWFLTSESLSTIQYLILILTNKILMMHRVTLCLLLEGSLEGQNGKGWHLYIIRENITFIYHTSDMIITINCALPNYDPMSETFIVG